MNIATHVSDCILAAEHRILTKDAQLPGTCLCYISVLTGELRVSSPEVADGRNEAENPPLRPGEPAGREEGTDYLLRPGDSLLIYQQSGAALHPVPGTSAVFVCLDPVSVIRITGDGRLMKAPIFTERDTEAAASLHEASGRLLRSGASPDLEQAASVLSFLQCLLNLAETPSLPEPLTALSPHRARLYEDLMTYIRAHFDEELSQGGAASHFGITPQYLGRFLKETAGLSFREYILACRRQRRETEDMYRFRPVSPNAPLLPGEEAPGRLPDAEPGRAVFGSGRKEFRREDALPGSAGRTAGGDQEVLPPRRISLRASVDPRHEMTPFWKCLINLGYAADLRNSDIETALRYVQREVGFTCGRICRITDLITRRSVGDVSYYDFSAVFALLDPVIDSGMTPFLELGNKSFMIHETTQLIFTPVSPTDTREYYNHLLEILPEFIRGCINHYGQSCFDTWYFEISYMYTDDDARERFGFAQYVKIFRKILKEIRSFSSECRVGGPGFNDWSDPSAIRQMIRLLSSSGCSPDFYSAYIYPIERDSEGRVRLSGDPMTGIARARTFSEMVHGISPGAEVWITECNSSLSSRTALNDSCYQAAYLAHMVMGLLGHRITALGYYLLSDAPLRYGDTPGFLFGGWGLISDRGVAKPSFHLYRMLSLLGRCLIRHTDNCLITANSHGSFRILLYRNRHPLTRYLYENVLSPDLEDPDAVFEPDGTDRCHLVLDQVLKGTYLVKEYRIDRNHSSLWQALREMDYLYPPDQRTVEELRTSSYMVPRTSVCRLAEGEPFVLDLELRGIDVRLITVDLYASHM